MNFIPNCKTVFSSSHVSSESSKTLKSSFGKASFTKATSILLKLTSNKENHVTNGINRMTFFTLDREIWIVSLLTFI